MGRLEGKAAVVTGAAYGNGRDIALRLAEEGRVMARTGEVIFADGGLTAGMHSGAAAQLAKQAGTE